MDTPGTLLIVAYYWPPSGGAGVQRWLKLTKELARLGWKVHVLTVDAADATYPHWDESLLEDVAPEVSVHRATAFNPIAAGQRLFGRHANRMASSDLKGNDSVLGQISMLLRTHLFIPDPRKGWNRRAIAKGLEIVERHGIDWVITTSPPHSTQLIGRALKESTGVRWVADFRDPWTDVFYYGDLLHSKWSAQRDAACERSVMETADRLVVVHDQYRLRLEEKYAESAPSKLLYLPNGFDADDFTGRPADPEFTGFDLVYTGIMAAGYEPEVVIEGIRRFRQDTDRRVRLTIVGTAPESILDGFRATGIDVQCLGMQPHQVANAWQLQADVLLCLIPAIPGAELAHVPGKLFEYLAVAKPILNIGPRAGETAGIIARCNAGATFERDQPDAVAEFLTQAANGSIRASNPSVVAEYTRSAQAARLSDWLLH